MMRGRPLGGRATAHVDWLRMQRARGGLKTLQEGEMGQVVASPWHS
jgi:hypothetical protein